METEHTWLESGPAMRTAKALTESLKVAEKNSTWQAGACCLTALIMRMESEANPSCYKTKDTMVRPRSLVATAGCTVTLLIVQPHMLPPLPANPP